MTGHKDNYGKKKEGLSQPNPVTRIMKSESAPHQRDLTKSETLSATENMQKLSKPFRQLLHSLPVSEIAVYQD
jgi:hypothetical protein